MLNAADPTRPTQTRDPAHHRAKLAELASLAEKVEVMHFGDPGVPDGLATLLERMIAEMDAPVQKDERRQFPIIRNGGPGRGGPILAIRADQDRHVRDIAALRQLTAGLMLPEGACLSWARLYAGLEEVIADLEGHIRCETGVLFTPAEQVNVGAA